MASRFEFNPSFIPQELHPATVRAIDDLTAQIRGDAARNASWSQTIPPNVQTEPARVDARGPFGVVKLGRAGFKGNFFEPPQGTKARFTKKGAYRGKGPGRPFIKPAVDRGIARGLDINRYL